jgi:hypothetical protein
MKHTVLRELQKELAGRRSDSSDAARSVLERAAGLKVDPDVANLLHTADSSTPSQWVAWAEQQAWLDVACFSCGVKPAGDVNTAPKRGLQPADREAFLLERDRLMDYMYPRPNKVC